VDKDLVPPRNLQLDKPANHVEHVCGGKPGDVVYRPEKIGVEKGHVEIKGALEVYDGLDAEIFDGFDVFVAPDLRRLKEAGVDLGGAKVKSLL
jgi:hypothetical protein